MKAVAGKASTRGIWTSLAPLKATYANASVAPARTA